MGNFAMFLLVLRFEKEKSKILFFVFFDNS